MSLKENKELIRRYYEMYDKGDIDSIMIFVSEDITTTFQGMPAPLDKTGLADYMRGFHAGFPNMILTIRNQIAEGDQVVTAVSFKGIHSADLLGVPPSGRSIEYTEISIHRIVDGTQIGIRDRV